jgi:hypothetical protein
MHLISVCRGVNQIQGEIYSWVCRDRPLFCDSSRNETRSDHGKFQHNFQIESQIPNFSDCTSDAYFCNLECLPFSTVCDGPGDCVLGNTALDEPADVCSGEFKVSLRPCKLYLCMQDTKLYFASIPERPCSCFCSISLFAQLAYRLIICFGWSLPPPTHGC